MKPALPFLLCVIFLLGIPCLSAQSTYTNKFSQDSLHLLSASSTPTFGPVVGYRYMGENAHFLEAGFTYAGIGHGITGYELTVISALSKEKKLMGIGLGYFGGFAIFEAGISGTLYSDFDQVMVFAKPSFGLGIGGFATLNYGLNLPMGSNPFKPTIRLHEIRVVFRWPVRM